MPIQHQKRDILSPQETKLFRHIEQQLHYAFANLQANAIRNQSLHPNLPVTRPLSNFPLSQLVDGWSEYGREHLPATWGITDPDDGLMAPRTRAFWPSAGAPIFRWQEGVPLWEHDTDTRGNRNIVVPRAISNEWQVRRIDFWRDRYNDGWGDWTDPGVEQFFNALEESQTQEDLVSRLEESYPPMAWWSEFQERRNKAYSQTLDLVIAKETGWSTPLMQPTTDGVPPNETHLTPISPLCVIEYDGMCGFRVVNGAVEWSTDAVGRMMRYGAHTQHAGQVQSTRVQQRLQKLNDKFAILNDIGIPATVLPHDSLRCYSGLGIEFMAADISIQYLYATSYYTNLAENSPNIVGIEDLWSVLAPQMHLGAWFSQLNQTENCGHRGVTIERIENARIPMDNHLGDINQDGPFVVNIAQSHLLEQRMERYRANPAQFYSNLGVDPDNCTGIRLTVTHPVHGELSEEIALDPMLFSGSTICPENDHLMLAGWVSANLMVRINELNQQTS